MQFHIKLQFQFSDILSTSMCELFFVGSQKILHMENSQFSQLNQREKCASIDEAVFVEKLIFKYLVVMTSNYAFKCSKQSTKAIIVEEEKRFPTSAERNEGKKKQKLRANLVGWLPGQQPILALCFVSYFNRSSISKY